MNRADIPSTPTGAAALVLTRGKTSGPDEARALAREILQAPPDPVTHARVCLELTRMGGRLPVARAEAHLRRALRHPDVPLSVKYQLHLTTMLNRLPEGEADEARGAVTGSLAPAPGARTP